MGIIIRQSIKSTIVSYVGIVIGTFNTLWLLPRFLLPEEIGLVRLLQDIPLLLAVFLQLGAANLAEKFFPYFKDEKNKDKGFFMLLILYPLLGFAIFLIAFFSFKDFWIGIFNSRSPLLVDYFLFIIPLAFFIMYSSVLEAYTRVNLRIVVPSIIREIFVRTLFSLVIILYAIKVIQFEHLIILFTLMYGLSLLLLVGYIKNLKRLFLDVRFDFLDKNLLKEMGKYVLFIIPGTAGSLIASKIDTLMLGAISGLNFVGIYSLAYFIGAVVEVPRRALSQITIPFISQAWKANDLLKIEELYKRTSLNQLIVGVFIFLLIWCNVDDILNLIPNSEVYKEGKYVILFIGLSRIFDMVTGINTEIILYSKYYKFNLISILFLAVLAVITNLIFIPLYAINGAALGFVITIFLYNVLKSGFIWWRFKMQPFSKATFIAVGIAFLTFVIATAIPNKDHSLISSITFIFIRSGIICLLFLSLIFILNVSEDINNFVLMLISKVKLYFNKK